MLYTIRLQAKNFDPGPETFFVKIYRTTELLASRSHWKSLNFVSTEDLFSLQVQIGFEESL